MVRGAEKSPPSHGTDCGRGGSVHAPVARPRRPPHLLLLYLRAHHQQQSTTPPNAAKRPTLYPPPPNPLRSVITLYPLRSPATAPACCARTHSTTRTVPAAHLPALTALCNECTLQSLQTAITLHPYTHPARAYRSHLIPPCTQQQGSPPPVTRPRRPTLHPARSTCERTALLISRTPAPRTPAPRSTGLHSTGLHSPHPANSPSLQLPDKSKSRQVGKLASWQVGKHCHLPLHHQPVPAAPLFSLTPPVNHRPLSYRG